MLVDKLIKSQQCLIFYNKDIILLNLTFFNFDINNIYKFWEILLYALIVF